MGERISRGERLGLGYEWSGSFGEERWPSSPELAPGELHLWSARLDPSAAALSWLQSLLSPAERVRSARLRQLAHRDRYETGRGLLRVLLGGYARTDPRHLVFAYGPGGKPHLDPPSDLRFNLAHSSSLALFAVARGVEVGVDLERLRTRVDGELIAERFFTTPEREELARLDPGRRREAFLRLWTRKEAYLKARGEGVAGSLSSFSVAGAAGEVRALGPRSGSRDRTVSWSCFDCDPAPGYVGAVSVPRGHWRLRRSGLAPPEVLQRSLRSRG